MMDQLIKKKNFQRLLQVSRTTLENWEKQEPNFPKRVQIGKTILYDVEDVKKFLNEKKKKDG